MKPDHFWQDLRVAQDNALEQSHNVRTVRERMPSRPPIEERRVRWPLAVAATLSLAAAVLLGVVGLHRTPSAISFEVGDKKEAGKVETWIAAPDGANLPIKFSDGSDVTVESGARARVTQLDANGAHVLLERGRAVASVVHRENTHWQVAAGPFLVSVIGTRFAVSWDPVSEVFRLHLHEGRVLVSGSFLRDPQSVSTGQSLRASCKRGAPKSSKCRQPAEARERESTPLLRRILLHSSRPSIRTIPLRSRADLARRGARTGHIRLDGKSSRLQGSTAKHSKAQNAAASTQSAVTLLARTCWRSAMPRVWRAMHPARAKLTSRPAIRSRAGGAPAMGWG